MTTLAWLAPAFQVVIALGIVNVWVLRYGRATPWRPGSASNMVEEFRHYGLPDWVRPLVGGSKLAAAVLLLFGLWYPLLTAPAATLLALLMVGAVAAHIRVRDPVHKSLPALAMLSMCLFVIAAHG